MWDPFAAHNKLLEEIESPVNHPIQRKHMKWNCGFKQWNWMESIGASQKGFTQLRSGWWEIDCRRLRSSRTRNKSSDFNLLRFRQPRWIFCGFSLRTENPPWENKSATISMKKTKMWSWRNLTPMAFRLSTSFNSGETKVKLNKSKNLGGETIVGHPI